MRVLQIKPEPDNPQINLGWTDLVYLGREFLGDDYADSLREEFSRLQDEADYTRKKVSTDLDSYESTLEDQFRAIQEALEILQEVETGKTQKLRPAINRVIRVLEGV